MANITGCPNCTKAGADWALASGNTGSGSVAVIAGLRVDARTVAKALGAGRAVGLVTGLFRAGGGFILAALAGVFADSRTADLLPARTMLRSFAALLIAVGAYTATGLCSASDVQDEPTAVSAGEGATSSVRCGCSSPCRLARGDGDGHRSKGQRRNRARRAATIEPTTATDIAPHASSLLSMGTPQLQEASATITPAAGGSEITS